MRVQYGALLLLLAGCAFDESGLPAGANGGDGDGGIIDPSVDASPTAPDAFATPDAVVDTTPDAMPENLPACMTDSQYVGRPNHPHRYRAVSQNRNFEEAEDACADDEAYLIVIEDADENAWARGLQNGDQWIGLDDRGDEGEYEWDNGVPLDRGVDYENWGGGEPNNFFGAEDCIQMLSDGVWNDTGCDDDYRYICECDPTWDTDDHGGGGGGGDGPGGGGPGPG